MQILRASEDYLEAILMIQERKGKVRSIDIADFIDVSKPTVSYATKRLRESGYIEMDKDNYITLTETGLRIAKEMLKRHTSITQFLISLGVDKETAERDACKIEHDISEESFKALCKFVESKK